MGCIMGIGYPYLCLHKPHFAPGSFGNMGGKLFEKVFPRHTQLVREINRRFIENEVCSKWPDDQEKKNSMAIVSEGNIKMAFLSVVGSKSVNGVAALHTKLLREKLLRDFAELYPHKFNNKNKRDYPKKMVAWL